MHWPVIVMTSLNVVILQPSVLFLHSFLSFSLCFSGEQVQQNRAGSFQGRGLHSQDSTASQHLASVWLLGVPSPAGQEKNSSSHHGAHDIGDAQRVGSNQSLPVLVECIIWQYLTRALTCKTKFMAVTRVYVACPLVCAVSVHVCVCRWYSVFTHGAWGYQIVLCNNKSM